MRRRKHPTVRQLERMVRRLEADGHEGYAEELRNAINAAEAQLQAVQT